MQPTSNAFVCACTLAGRPILCRSCQRRAGLQQRSARTPYHAATRRAALPPVSRASA